jgi:ABC-2 type transport system permease protein
MSAIFYSVESFPPLYQQCFLLNPVYVHITYFRQVFLDGTVPGWQLHGLCAGYALLALLTGLFIYKKCNREFIYYV